MDIKDLIVKKIENELKSDIFKAQKEIRKAIYNLDRSLCRYSKDYGMASYYDCFIDIDLVKSLKDENRYERLLEKRVDQFYKQAQSLLDIAFDEYKDL